jgi:pyruvate ferredoxin oxidoreductase gamma subunit
LIAWPAAGSKRIAAPVQLELPPPPLLRRTFRLFLTCFKVSPVGTAKNARSAYALRYGTDVRPIAPALEERALLQIIIQGRGGQGAQTAGNLLAMAFFAEGRYVQSFASYGGARRGTPVSSFIRVDDRPVRVRCDIERADAILCFDATLLDGRLLATARPDTLIVVNSSRTREQFADTLAGYRVIPVDGLAISRRHGLGRIVNSALLGAFWRAIDASHLDVLTRVLGDESPKLHDENIAACEEGYRSAEALVAPAEAVA